jgi:hypothetical protein
MHRFPVLPLKQGIGVSVVFIFNYYFIFVIVQELSTMSSANKNTPASPAFKKSLSPSVRKALVEFWGSEEIINQPEILADLGPESIGRINRIGSKSLSTIAQALNSSGYIDSPHLWLFTKK